MKKIGEVSEQERQRLLSTIGDWKHKKGNLCDYYCAVENENRMFIKIRPGGKVHKHVDALWNKRHTVLETNDQCFNMVGGVSYQCDLRGIYEMDASLEHESLNLGQTDRIHLVETL